MPLSICLHVWDRLEPYLSKNVQISHVALVWHVAKLSCGINIGHHEVKDKYLVGYISHDNIHEINTWTCPIGTQCG